MAAGELRRYHGQMADSARWERFELRDDDVIISTPSKCGTTWMQHIVGMLLLDVTELEAPISELSPWLDMLIRTDDEVFAMLAGQPHRRFIKSHTPLDGVPEHPGVTYITVIRHPLDVALSDLDHTRNTVPGRAIGLRDAATGVRVPLSGHEPAPSDPTELLRWFIDNSNGPTGSGPNGLADFCQQASTYWHRRHRPNVHLFHYQDLWDDLDGEMRHVAAALGVTVDEHRWPAFVDAATLGSMRARADVAAPEAHQGFWRSPADFFRRGGRREWASLLSDDEIAGFHARLEDLAGEAAPWILLGRAGLV